MDNSPIKDDIRLLLDRRKEIMEEVSRLQREYNAIGHVIEEIIRIREREEDDGR